MVSIFVNAIMGEHSQTSKDAIGVSVIDKSMCRRDQRHSDKECCPTDAKMDVRTG